MNNRLILLASVVAFILGFLMSFFHPTPSVPPPTPQPELTAHERAVFEAARTSIACPGP